jgi:hypothetical protein
MRQDRQPSGGFSSDLGGLGQKPEVDARRAELFHFVLTETQSSGHKSSVSEEESGVFAGLRRHPDPTNDAAAGPSSLINS